MSRKELKPDAGPRYNKAAASATLDHFPRKEAAMTGAPRRPGGGRRPGGRHTQTRTEARPLHISAVGPSTNQDIRCAERSG